MEHPRSDLKNSGPRSVLGYLVAFSFLCTPMFASAQVLINEVAWMGTSDSSSNEWAELSNTGGNTDLTGWVLRIVGKKDIALSGNIASNGYYLIERTDDNTVPPPADLISPFGGFVDAGAVLVLLDGAGKEQDRVDGSDGWKIGGGEVKGNKTTKETAQRNGSMWTTGTPTPRAINAGVSVQSAPDAPASPQGDQGVTVTNEAVSTTAKNNVSYFPVEPQIFAKITAQTQTVSVGAATTFTGRVWGLKKEPIENARMMWTFGDGASAEGASVAHAYYYPGEYTVIIDASSGYYAASDRVRIIAALPLLSLRVGGDEARSFVSIENRGSDELDLSEWQIHTQGKIFMLPKNTLIGAHKTLTLASEVTGLITPTESIASLHFPNGSAVPLQEEVKVVAMNTKSVVIATETKKASALRPASQTASALDAFPESIPRKPSSTNDTLWMWYVGVAFLGVFAALGLRFARGGTPKSETLTADDFDITEEDEDKKDDLF